MMLVKMTMETMVQSVWRYLKAGKCPVWVHKTLEDLLFPLFPMLCIFTVCAFAAIVLTIACDLQAYPTCC